MALYESVSTEPTPWVFPEQRESAKFEGVQTILHLRPMSYKEWNRFSMRRAEAEERRSVAVEIRADKVSEIDAEGVRSVCTRAENIYKDGDDLTADEEIARFVEQLDWTRMQQVLFAVRSASALKEGAKNS